MDWNWGVFEQTFFTWHTMENGMKYIWEAGLKVIRL